MNQLIPMLSLAGEPDESRLVTLLNGFVNCGISQFLLYPRSGCKIEYMSDEWHRICGFCIEFAAKHDMKVWLYDEFNWPSGSCAGLVPLENPEYISRCIDISDGHYKVFRNAISYKRGDPIPVPAPFVTDLFNKKAVECFIGMTHERYFEWFGKYFGNVIVGMFSDEPSFIYPCLNGPYPYYEGIEADYNHKTGRNLDTDFEEYAFDNTRSELFAPYYSLLTDKFKHSYFDTINEWCKNHGIEFTGHLLSDSSVSGSIKASGNELKALDGFSIPGVDNIFTATSAESLMSYSFVENTVRNSKRPAMAELFALGGCDMPYAKQLQMLYLASSYGINRYVLAITHLQSVGNYTIYGYYNNYSMDNPNHGALKLLGKLSEKACVYADKTATASVSIRLPIYAECQDGLRGSYDKMMLELINCLSKNQISWKLIREDDVAEQNTISLHGKKYYDENCGQGYVSTENLINVILGRLSHRIRVTDEFGNTAENILIRTFTDRSFLIFNLDTTRETRRVIISIDGKSYCTDMDKYAVLDSIPQKYDFVADILAKPYVKYNSHSIFRLNMMAKKPFEFTCNDNAEVCLAVRNYPKAYSVFIDGLKISADKPCDLLTGSFDGMYLKSSYFHLCKGAHTAKCDNPDDKPYLPTALLIGEFDPTAYSISKRTGKVANKAAGVFFGSADVLFDAEIPNVSGKLFVEYSCRGYYSQLYVNGKFVGEGFETQNRIELDDELKGKKTVLEIRLFSSQAPIFGELDKYEQLPHNPKPWYDGIVPYTTPETLSVYNICFVKVTE